MMPIKRVEKRTAARALSEPSRHFDGLFASPGSFVPIIRNV